MPPKYSREITCPVVLADSLKNQCRTSPCEAACPAGTSIQKVQTLVAQGHFAEALTYLRAKNPFSAVTGRVCPQFCKTQCNRAQVDEPLHIRAIERSAGDMATAAPLCRRPITGKRVVVVGGGPAGLTAAYYLALLGHAVEMIESAPVLGGIPRHAVPDFRLPRDIVDREVGRILETGVRARVNTRVGRDVTLAELDAGADAVVLATGTPLENVLAVDNADLALKAVDFLQRTALGEHPNVGRRVVVMGGGGVAFDCAFTARRLGANDVQVICLEKEGAMRAPEEDLEQARREGVQVLTGCTLSGIRTEAGKVSGVDWFRVRDCRFDEQGRVTLEPEPGGTCSIACDTVIFAVGTRTDAAILTEQKLQLTARNRIVVDTGHATSRDGLYAAGDVVSGPASIAEAVGSGRRAAFGVHARLTGESAAVWIVGEDGQLAPRPDMTGNAAPHVVEYEELYAVSGAAATAEILSAQEERCRDGLTSEEIRMGFTPEQAMAEAARCLHCGHCKGCGSCVDDCPGYVLELHKSPEGDRPVVCFGEECWHCANCRTSCPCGAIDFEFPLRMQV